MVAKMRISTNAVSFSLASSTWRKKFVMEGCDFTDDSASVSCDPNQMRRWSLPKGHRMNLIIEILHLLTFGVYHTNNDISTYQLFVVNKS